jgi:hypothetical protein
MALKNFDTVLTSDFGEIEVGVDDEVILTQIAQIISGRDGDPGPPGPPGGAVFEYDQAVAATVWNITHNLQRFPPVTVIDSAGTLTEGEVKYLDINHVQLLFNFAFAGTAYLG